MSKKVKVKIRDLNVYYDKKQALDGLNLDIRANEILSVFGPSGSGITSLLQSMNRLIELLPTARVDGDILIDEKSIFDKAVSLTKLRRRVGMVFDIPAPLPMSIYDNVAYGPHLTGEKSRKKLDETVEIALRGAALWDEVKDRLKASGFSLSGGQQQRLCIARVLALDPEIILLDRPCSGLDPISTAKIEESLVMLKKKYTIILAPHNMQQASRVSDRAAFMLSGKLIEEGITYDVFSNPKDSRTNDYVTGRFG